MEEKKQKKIAKEEDLTDQQHDVFVFAFGFLYVLPFGLTNLISVDWNIIPHNIYLEIAFVVICTTFIAYLCCYFFVSFMEELSKVSDFAQLNLY